MTPGTPGLAGNTSFSRSVLIVWLLCALDALIILVTYTRVPSEQLYHVTNEGLRGGLSRALVFLNYPVAFVAVAIAWLSVAVLRIGSGRRKSPSLLIAAWLSTLLCLVAAFPGVVNQDNLDARPVNGVPVLGVAIAIVLSFIAMRNPSPVLVGNRTLSDWIGICLIALATFVALPLIVADLGFFIDDVPILSRIFIAREVPDGETLSAVHPGHHHGVDGLLFIVIAVVLARPWRALPADRISSGVGAYLAFMMGYGIANLANDVWLEQLTKRGVTDYEIPSFARPELTREWAIVIMGMGIIWAIFFRRHPAHTQVPGY